MSAISDPAFGAALDLIHEAALDVQAWDKLLRMLAQMTGCIAGGLTFENPSNGNGYPVAYFGFDADHVQKTFDYYLPMNPLFSIAPRMQPGFVVTNGDVIGLPDFQQTEFYHGWAKPQGLCSPISLVLHRAGPCYAPLTLVRPDGAGEASATDRKLLDRLAPHLIQAMRTNIRLELLETKRQTLEDILSSLTPAIILLDAQRRVLFANTAGEALLARSTMIRTASGQLEATNPAFNARLQHALAVALLKDHPKGADMDVTTDDGAAMSVTITPTTAKPLQMPGAEHGRALLLISNKDVCTSAHLAATARAFRLTPAELRVLEAILDGTGLARAAERLGVGYATAKTHLASIFAKTETRRQAELIKFVLRASHPHL